VDPRPDIVVEIDLTNDSHRKFPISAALGVPETWRYDEWNARFYRLDGQDYLECSASLSSPVLSAVTLTTFIEQMDNSFGELLRRWRESEADEPVGAGSPGRSLVTSRHVSFIETGRAKPSCEMVGALSSVLDVPLRERNVRLHAAGYAPIYRETL
jgi:hypothetical protein